MLTLVQSGFALIIRLLGLTARLVLFLRSRVFNMSFNCGRIAQSFPDLLPIPNYDLKSTFYL